jgi:hypothetical protein
MRKTSKTYDKIFEGFFLDKNQEKECPEFHCSSVFLAVFKNGKCATCNKVFEFLKMG